MNRDAEMIKKHRKDLEQLEKIEPSKRLSLVLGWLKDKRESKGQLASWVLSQYGQPVQELMVNIALDRSCSDRYSIRALDVIAMIGLPLGERASVRLCFEGEGGRQPIRAAIYRMITTLRFDKNLQQL